MSAYLDRLKAITTKNGEKPLSNELSKPSKEAFEPFEGNRDRGFCRNDSALDRQHDPDPVELDERKGVASDSVPERYLDAWARLQCQRPEGIPEPQWRQAINDAGRFLDQWGKLAVEFGWSAGNLFDVPRDGRMGLVWWLLGRTVTALGPEHAGCGTPAYDRITRQDWVNPYSRPVRPVLLSAILERQQEAMAQFADSIPRHRR
jgi:hypothetical protein